MNIEMRWQYYNGRQKYQTPQLGGMNIDGNIRTEGRSTKPSAGVFFGRRTFFFNPVLNTILISLTVMGFGDLLRFEVDLVLGLFGCG